MFEKKFTQEDEDFDRKSSETICKQITDLITEKKFPMEDTFITLLMMSCAMAIAGGINKPNLLAFCSYVYEKMDESHEHYKKFFG